MSKQVTLGGQRLGTGNKMEVNLHNYDRANFNLSKTFRSSMSCGTLVPFYCNVGLNGDTFDIDLKHLVKTLPTNGPLMGNFKMQMDLFSIPMRLYNGLLHNNMNGVGLKMQEVKIPKVVINQQYSKAFDLTEPYKQVNPSSLLAYLGVRGLGSVVNAEESQTITRRFNALPILSYIDIFKNYYSNKQEKYFYQISATDKSLLSNMTSVSIGEENSKTIYIAGEEDYKRVQTGGLLNPALYIEKASDNNDLYINFPTEEDMDNFYNDYLSNELGLIIANGNNTRKIFFNSLFYKGEKIKYIKLGQNLEIIDAYKIKFSIKEDWEAAQIKLFTGIQAPLNTYDLYTITAIQQIGNGLQRNVTELVPIELESLDELRNSILASMQLGVTLNVNRMGKSFAILDNICGDSGSGQNRSRYSQNGLLVKTYMSDIFNNWLNTETIDGANGISEITKVSITDGGFTIDALNLAQKVYNLLNRIAVSGGTYDDWQEVVWDVEAIRKAESPIYEGGYSAMIGFEEVVQTAQSQGSDPLGSLAGKGQAYNLKGGQISIKVKEPSIIMGICSITPIIDYSQGNKWFMTELDSFDDLHMPALDGIGFQDLMTETMCATDTYLEHKGGGVLEKASEQNAVGKQPAWINWQTDYNECFGDFAIPTRAMYMTINRNYDTDENGNIEDVTTYIDPKKYNYAFADTALEAQNFWVQIGMDIYARRKMSAKIIPTM